MAGGHKHKWTWILKYAPDHFGEKGFRPPTSRERPAINLYQISTIAERLIRSGEARFEDGKVVVDLASHGYKKVLARGALTVPVKILAESWSRGLEQKLAAFNSEIAKAG